MPELIRVRQDAAWEKGLELVFDELGQVRPGVRLDLGEKSLEPFPHHLTEVLSSGRRRS